MKYTSVLIILFVLPLSVMIQSCEEDELNATLISSNGSLKSHNMGANCMNCHAQGGDGEGRFKVAGTVYDSLGTAPYPNATVQLYDQPNGTGTLAYTIEVDGKGNFYTTENIDFAKGLYPAVMGNVGARYMQSSIPNGQCNSCHGSSTGKIWTY